jgi:hypothetical protein
METMHIFWQVALLGGSDASLKQRCHLVVDERNGNTNIDLAPVITVYTHPVHKFCYGCFERLRDGPIPVLMRQ